MKKLIQYFFRILIICQNRGNKSVLFSRESRRFRRLIILIYSSSPAWLFTMDNIEESDKINSNNRKKIRGICEICGKEDLQERRLAGNKLRFQEQNYKILHFFILRDNSFKPLEILLFMGIFNDRYFSSCQWRFISPPYLVKKFT